MEFGFSLAGMGVSVIDHHVREITYMSMSGKRMDASCLTMAA